ncbi:MAG: amidohydrolase family protein [Acidobacteriota bacterium]
MVFPEPVAFRWWALLMVMVLVGCGGGDVRMDVDAILHNVTIVDVRDGTLITDRAITVSDGTIGHVLHEDRIDEFATETLIDGGGNYVIPALADAHVHIQSWSELRSFVRYGVGLVVNMSGHVDHLAMREAVASRETLGPSIVTVGPTLDGDPPTNPLFITVDPSTVREIVGWIDEKGYDAVKVYQQMDADTLRATLEAASDRGLMTTGHVSRTIGIAAVIDAGQRYVAHGEELAFEAFDETSRTYDVKAIPELADRLSEAGVTVTPMQAYLENIPRQVNGLETYLGSEEMRMVPAATRMSFDRRQGWFANREDPEGFSAQIASLSDFVAALTVALHERGVPLVLGTDAGFGGAIPGYGAHEELETLVDAGLTKLAALQTATLEAGKYASRIDPTRTPWGQVRPGYAASLLLLGGNPVESIDATQEIHGVMIDGRWIDQEELAAMETDLLRRQAKMLPLSRAFEDAILAGDADAAAAALASIPADMAGEPLITPDNCIFLGYRHYYGGNRPLAGRLYELCATMHPYSSPLWIHIARAYESEGDTEAAIRAYQRAQELNPWYGDPGAAIERLRGENAAVGH